MLGPDRRRPDRRLSSLAVHILREYSDRASPAWFWSICICRTIAKKNTKPLDVVGLILFGSGVALLSYVLEIFGDHTLSVGEIIGLLAISLALHRRLWAARDANCVSAAAVEPVSHSHVQRGGERQLLHPAGHRRRAISLAASLPGRAGIHARFSRACCIMPQAMAAMSTKFLMPRILARVGYRGVLVSNTDHPRSSADAVRDDRTRARRSG